MHPDPFCPHTPRTAKNLRFGASPNVLATGARIVRRTCIDTERTAAMARPMVGMAVPVLGRGHRLGTHVLDDRRLAVDRCALRPSLLLVVAAGDRGNRQRRRDPAHQPAASLPRLHQLISAGAPSPRHRADCRRHAVPARGLDLGLPAGYHRGDIRCAQRVHGDAGKHRAGRCLRPVLLRACRRLARLAVLSQSCSTESDEAHRMRRAGSGYFHLCVEYVDYVEYIDYVDDIGHRRYSQRCTCAR